MREGRRVGSLQGRCRRHLHGTSTRRPVAVGAPLVRRKRARLDRKTAASVL